MFLKKSSGTKSCPFRINAHLTIGGDGLQQKPPPSSATREVAYGCTAEADGCACQRLDACVHAAWLDLTLNLTILVGSLYEEP